MINCQVMAQKVREFYWANKEIEKDEASAVVDAITDSHFSHPIDTSVKIHFLKSKSNVFVYHFGYRGAHSLTHLKLDAHPPQIDKTDMHYGVANGRILCISLKKLIIFLIQVMI